MSRSDPVPAVSSALTNDQESVSRRVRFFRHPVTGVFTVVVSMFAMILLSGLLSAGFYLLAESITGRPAEGVGRTLLQIGSYLMTTVIAVLLILLWRMLAGLPRRGLGISPLSRVWLFVPGFLLAVGLDYGAAAIAVAGGASTWATSSFDGLLPLLLAGTMILLGQALPEELLWRGHLADLLGRRMPAWAVVLVTSLAFGALHIVSGSDARGLGEQLLYVLQAAALGMLLIALRFGTASLWAAIGFHTGYNVFFEVATPIAGSYAIELLTRAGLLAIGAALILVVRRGRRNASIGDLSAGTTGPRG